MASWAGRTRRTSTGAVQHSTDLSDGVWEYLKLDVAAPNRGGRPRTHSTPEMFSAISYVLKSSRPWRLLPKDFAPRETAWCWFGRWRADGTFERLDAALRERPRSCLGRNLHPSTGVSPTPGPPRKPPELAATREDTTATRRLEAGSSTCWWTSPWFRTAQGSRCH